MPHTYLVLFIVFLVLFIQRGVKEKRREESFISIVNHTFRTPLTRIKWMSEALTDENTPRKQELEIATDISNSVTRLLSVVDTLVGIKDITSKASYEIRAVSLREILEAAIAKYRVAIAEKGITLAIPTSANMPLLSVDTKKISFAIDVIIENAIAYSNHGGTITLTEEMRGNKIVLSARDTGIGLTWKDKHNLYRQFYRGEAAKKMNTDGMGLGLYIAREIVRRHGGHIHAVSGGTNKGTTFSLELPTAQ